MVQDAVVCCWILWSFIAYCVNGNLILRFIGYKRKRNLNVNVVFLSISDSFLRNAGMLEWEKLSVLSLYAFLLRKPPLCYSSIVATLLLVCSCGTSQFLS